MNIPNKIKDFLSTSAEKNNSIILVTSLDKIIFNSVENSKEDSTLLPKNIQELFKTMISSNEVVKVFNTYKYPVLKDDMEIKNEVIMLILNNNEVIGSLIVLNHTLDFEVSNFAFTSTILNTLKTVLKKTQTD